jgi:hypothetical protein
VVGIQAPEYHSCIRGVLCLRYDVFVGHQDGRAFATACVFRLADAHSTSDDATGLGVILHEYHHAA